MKYCSNCGEKLDDDYDVCLKCGQKYDKPKTQKCKYCGEKIDYYAKVCPFCKKTLNFSVGRVIVGVLVSIFLFALFTTISIDSENESNGEVNETEKIYNVGDTIKCNHFNVTLKSFKIKKKGTSIDSYSVISDPEWIAVILTVKNTSDSEHTFYTHDVKLKNSNGEILSSSFITYKIWGVEMLDSPTLSANGKKTGYIQFSNTNKDNSNLQLQIDCGTLFNDNVYTFNLK